METDLGRGNEGSFFCGKKWKLDTIHSCSC